MRNPKLAVIVGSILARQRGDMELIDFRNYPMPLFAEMASPAWAPSGDEVARRWQKKVSEFDIFIFTAAEYNRGPTAALKSALDYAYKERNNKPVAFAGYGGVGGARAVEQLRLNAIELQMAPIRTAVHTRCRPTRRCSRTVGSSPSSTTSTRPPRTCSISWPGGPTRSMRRATRRCRMRLKAPDRSPTWSSFHRCPPHGKK